MNGNHFTEEREREEALRERLLRQMEEPAAPLTADERAIEDAIAEVREEDSGMALADLEYLDDAHGGALAPIAEARRQVEALHSGRVLRQYGPEPARR